MRFSAALDSMKRGQRMTRLSWGPNRWVTFDAIQMMLFERSFDGWLVPWNASGRELFECLDATDWLPVAAEDAAPVLVRDEEPR